jgi:hypothetical protein
LIAISILTIVPIFIPAVSDWIYRGFFGSKWAAMRSPYASVFVGVLALSGAIGLALVFGIAQPRYGDEFSNLLLSDTLLQGKLANPVHPLWIHFESFHILQQPVYASKFPPGQGLTLAIGKLIGGHPIMGVWMTVALTFILFTGCCGVDSKALGTVR